LNLGNISTHWSALSNPGQFVVRYAGAIRHLLYQILRNSHDADDVLQDFLLGVTQHGFPCAQPGRGRFRNYLFVAVRNAALKYLEKKRSRQQREERLDPAAAATGPGEEWVEEWRRCILNRALAALHHHQRQSAGNLAHTVLTVRIEHPDADSSFLAEETSRRCGRTVRADSYRQHLHRARRLFAQMLLDEVAQTLEAATPEQVTAELIEVGLMPYVQPYLPPEWQ
jgi:RNA polymerase sigma factor (sigma-70 family)